MMEFHQEICLLSILAPTIWINQHQYLTNRNHPTLDKNDVFTSDLATGIASSVCCDPMQVAVGLGKSRERDVRVGGRIAASKCHIPATEKLAERWDPLF